MAERETARNQFCQLHSSEKDLYWNLDAVLCLFTFTSTKLTNKQNHKQSII